MIGQVYTIINALQSGEKKADDNYADHWEDIPDSEAESLNCVDQWQNTGPEEHKQMFALFDESEIFIGLCQHCVVLWLVI